LPDSYLSWANLKGAQRPRQLGRCDRLPRARVFSPISSFDVSELIAERGGENLSILIREYGSDIRKQPGSLTVVVRLCRSAGECLRGLPRGVGPISANFIGNEKKRLPVVFCPVA